MKNVLIGYKVSKGSFDGKDGKKIEYDNVNLIVGKLDDFGNGIQKIDSYKIKTAQFEEISNLDIESFAAAFQKNFFGREISVLGSIEYERFQITDVQIDVDSNVFSFTEEALKEFAENNEKIKKKE